MSGTVYLGTSAFAAVVLETLAESQYSPELVITRPDRPAGRGRKLTAPPVAEKARELDLPLYQPESVNSEEAWEKVEALEPETLCICAFGAIVKEPYLSDYEILNVHPSLLPRWRGAAPVERAIMAGDQQTGVSIMRLVEALDAGPVCAMQQVAIEPTDTYGSLASKLQKLGGEMLVQALSNPRTYEQQDESLVTYAEKITAGDRTLNPHLPAEQLNRVVRALTPHIGARVELPDGQFLGVSESRAIDSTLDEGALSNLAGRLVLGCAAGSGLELLTVQPAGGKPMSGQDYLRGHSHHLN